MKQVISIIILFTLIYNSFGYIFTFKIVQAQIRLEIKRKIESSLTDNQLEIFTFPSDKINSTVSWTREGKEFIYQNKMYDIIRKKEENGKIILFCLNDKKEEKLFTDLDNQVKKNLSMNGRVKQILTKSISNYFFERINLPEHSLQSNPHKLFYSKTYSDFLGEIESPPPKFS